MSLVTYSEESRKYAYEKSILSGVVIAENS